MADDSTAIAVAVWPGHAHDAPLLPPALARTHARVPDLDELVGDKGFDSDALRRACLRRGIMPQLAARKGNYVVAMDGDRVLGALGYVYYERHESVRIVELIAQEANVKGGLLNYARTNAGAL